MGRIGWLVLGLVLGAAVAAGGFWLFGHQEEKPQPVAAAAPDPQADMNDRIGAHWASLASEPGDPVIGNPNGDVTIIEFFDYTCSYCKAAEPRLVAAVDADPNVRLVLKEYPILTPQSLVATRAALAAQKQGKYQAFHQTLMRFQGELTEQVIFDTAKDVGLDMARLKKDMLAPEIADRIIANFNLARAIRAFQTPTFVAGNALVAHALSSTSASIDFPAEIAAARGR